MSVAKGGGRVEGREALRASLRKGVPPETATVLWERFEVPKRQRQDQDQSDNASYAEGAYHLVGAQGPVQQ